MWDQQTVPLNTKDAEQIHQAEVTTRSEDLVRFSATWDHLTDGDITHRNPTALGQFRHQPPFFWVRVLPRKKQQSHMPSPVTGQNGDRIYVGHA